MKKIKIPFSEQDLYDLQNGVSFDWNFDDVEVHLFKSEWSCDDCCEDQDEDADQIETEDGDVICEACSTKREIKKRDGTV